MRISDWSSDVCSSDLRVFHGEVPRQLRIGEHRDVAGEAEQHPGPEPRRIDLEDAGRLRRHEQPDAAAHDLDETDADAPEEIRRKSTEGRRVEKEWVGTGRCEW